MGFCPLIVPKVPLALYLLTMDYRPINAATQPITWPMPQIDAVLADVRGAQAFAGINFCSGYWQLPSTPTASSCTRHDNGRSGAAYQDHAKNRNSAANFQACVEPCFAELRAHRLAWIDDFAVRARTEAQLLDVLERFLAICKDRNLIVSIIKSVFFATSIKWCGRILDAQGIKMDPSNLLD